MTRDPIVQTAINTIRTLSIDAVQQAESGHPGTPHGPCTACLHALEPLMRFDPQDPIWPNRDRFVLSNGHASMLLADRDRGLLLDAPQAARWLKPPGGADHSKAG